MKEQATAQPRYCRNCHFPLPATAEYCPQCSQKYTTGKVTILQFLKDLFSNLFNLDSKLFKTLGALFIPAKLTQEYFRGRHKRYAHPLRVFLVSSLVFITVLGFQLNTGIRELDKIMPDTDTMIYEKKLAEKLDTIIPQIKAQQSNKIATQALDTVYTQLYPKKRRSDYYFNTIRLTSLIYGDTVDEIHLNLDDVLLSPQELQEKFQLDNFLDLLVVAQMAKFSREGDVGGFIRYLLGNLIWVLLLLIPTMALLLKLFYIRYNHYYVEHLIFLLHFHAFLFLFLVILLQLTAHLSPVFSTLSIFVYIYFYRSLRRYYQQGHLKTFLKFAVFTGFYFVGFLLAFMLVSFVSFLLF